MRFNAILRAKSYQCLHKNNKDYYLIFYLFFTGVACLSSVRAVKCLIYFFNERNSCLVLLCLYLNKVLTRDCLLYVVMKVRIKTRLHDPYILGYSCATKISHKK